MEYAFYEAVKNPMDNGLTYQAQPPGFIIDNTIGSTNRRASRKMKITVIKKIFIVYIMYFGSFSCFRELWFYSFAILYLFGLMQLHLKML